MNLFKKFVPLFLSISIIAFIPIMPVNASTKFSPENNLAQAIVAAENRFAEATRVLNNTASEAFSVFVTQPWSEEFRIAENYLRVNHPAEYNEYITSRAQLDDLQHLRFISTINAISIK